MPLKFPYENKPALNFGKIPTIKFPLDVESQVMGICTFTFLFDTGADITSLPISAAKQIGLDLSNCPKEKMSGYEGGKTSVYISKIRIKFDKKFFAIPCVFNPIEEVPILLGRAGILNRFNILLNGKSKEITFEEI